MRRVHVIVCALVLTTCSDSDHGGSIADAESEADASDTIFVVPDTAVDTDSAVIDTGGDVTAPDSAEDADTGGDTNAECALAGGFGCPCSGNDDCLDELCIEGPDGNFCTRSCVTECAAGYECLNTSLGGSDPISICVPRHVRLCRPCNAAADCQSPLDPGAAACVAGANPEDGSFCATSCAQDPCPAGFDCSDVTVGAGSARLCLPADGTCECRPSWTALGLTTDCARTNTEGSCRGTRACTAEGLSACSAATPRAEVCDLQDEDCDGATDDVAPSACTIDNDFGSCPGTAACDAGADTCSGRAPAEERCNLVDDDCDGDTDEAFSDCPAGSCSASDNGFVESGAPACVEGHCVYPSPHPCGQYVCDGDACASACEDDGACVDSAHCEAGACVPDTTGGESCDEDRECASGHCQNGFCCEAGDCCQSAADCPAGYTVAATCDDPTTCQGTRKDAQCVASMCASSAAIDDDTACGPAVQALDCSPARPRMCTGGVDQTAPECASGCGGDDECLEGYHCDGDCVPDVGPGDACDEDTDCAEGVCADGVCCDDRCDGECRACDVAGSLGTCGDVPDGEDPDGECGAIACTGYYFGFVGKTCYLRAPVSDEAAACGGDGACLDDAAACGASGQGAAATACHELCQVPTAGTCSGTNPGTCTNVTGGPQTCGVGACQVTVDSCVGGAPQECVPGQPTAEVCDGIDNDCDGLTDAADDDLELEPCENQKGVCKGADHPPEACVGGNWARCKADDYLDHDDRYEPGHEVTCETTVVQLGVDNDCDGAVDDDFVYTSPAGTTIAGAAKPCGLGVCAGGLTVCGLAGLICSNDGNIQPETCNGLDDDCDGLADSLDNNANPLRTVACENQNGVCNGATKPPSLCSAGQWQPCTSDTYTAWSTSYVTNEVAQCDGLDNDCDNTADDNLVAPNNTNQLGACAGTKKRCTGATGWADDYGSVLGFGQVEVPNASFADENCDGVDGDVTRAIFVAKSGADTASCGDKASPCLTVQQGLARATATGRPEVYVAVGSYAGPFDMAGGKSVYGGYNANWVRAARTTPGYEVFLTGGFHAGTSQYLTVRSSNITASLADLTINAPAASGTAGGGQGRSSYGVHVSGGTFTLSRVTVNGNNGVKGSDGANGTAASSSAAASGSPGGGANEFTTTCNDSSHGDGGAGGSNTCGGVSTNGGRGGNGGEMDTNCCSSTCWPGDWCCGVALDNTSGDGGSFGSGPAGGLSPGGGGGGCAPGNDGATCSNGVCEGGEVCGADCNANSYVPDGAGGGGAGAGGRLIGEFWYGRDGGDGSVGTHGRGGGGGGGSGGCDAGTDSFGAGGGGGGAGGCAASAAGLGGKGGGGSFGIFGYNAALVITDCIFNRGNGGAGGNGGLGRAGQPGGAGGAGGTGNGDSGAGGRGGNGGRGGHSGGGGGGGGGVSYGIYRFGGSTTVNGATYSGGGGGNGGNAGTSPGRPGGGGASGVQNTNGQCGNINGC